MYVIIDQVPLFIETYNQHNIIDHNKVVITFYKNNVHADQLLPAYALYISIFITKSIVCQLYNYPSQQNIFLKIKHLYI